MGWDEERAARACLTQVVQAGDDRLAEAIRTQGAAAVLDALRTSPRDDPWPRRARSADAAALAGQAQAHGLRFLVPGDDEWPPQLDDLALCGPLGGMGGVPVGLWACGRAHLRQACGQAVAIVGARAATGYGERLAAELASQLAAPAADGAAAWTVVSGGAYGIDAAAHRGALAVQGATVGVYANGLDAPYPPRNASLFERLRSEQVAVSELPPGMGPTRPGFLARNRLIAALGAGVVVVEAALRSGAKNTAAWGETLHRVVMAVPGPVYSAASAGTHQLIRDGRACLVTGPEDVQALISPLGATPPPADERSPDTWLDALPPAERAVWEAFPARGAVSAGELAVSAGLAMPACQAALVRLASLDLVLAPGPGLWRRARRAPAEAGGALPACQTTPPSGSTREDGGP